jgi:hypothetical protein
VLFLTVQGDVAPGSYEGRLLLSARDGVDLLRAEVPFRLTVIQPRLKVELTPPLNLTVREDGRGDIVTFTVSSNALQTETVTIAWLGDDGVWLRGEPVLVPPGGEGVVTLYAQGEPLIAGVYSGELRLTGREDVEIMPPDIPVTLTVVPVPFCEKWCLPIGGAGVALIAVGAALVSRLGQRPRPYGTLSVTKHPPGVAAPPVLSIRSRFGSNRAVIGSRKGADIYLPDPNLGARHAAIVAEKRVVRERQGKITVEVPRIVHVLQNTGSGTVTVDRLTVPPGGTSEPLKRGSRVGLGTGWELVYGE